MPVLGGHLGVWSKEGKQVSQVLAARWSKTHFETISSELVCSQKDCLYLNSLFGSSPCKSNSDLWSPPNMFKIVWMDSLKYGKNSWLDLWWRWTEFMLYVMLGGSMPLCERSDVPSSALGTFGILTLEPQSDHKFPLNWPILLLQS